MNRIEGAFERFDRADFVPAAVKYAAGADLPLPIGLSQTISQPTTVKMMLEWLDVKPGSKVLDVGSGSGWTTVLLSHLVGPKGHIYAVELIPNLVEYGQTNCRRAGVKNASFYQAGEHYGLPGQAPYDRILVSAAANKLPDELVEQLKPDGKMVIPVRYDVLEVTKDVNKKTEIISHPGFVFVPLL